MLLFIIVCPVLPHPANKKIKTIDTVILVKILFNSSIPKN
jgi:hypothetical protein